MVAIGDNKNYARKKKQEYPQQTVTYNPENCCCKILEFFHDTEYANFLKNYIMP